MLDWQRLNVRTLVNNRDLHVMPLFHIHGLIAGVLAPMTVGGYVTLTGRLMKCWWITRQWRWW